MSRYGWTIQHNYVVLLEIKGSSLLPTLYVYLISGNPVSGPAKCSFEAVLKYLNMTNNSEIYTLSRPVKNHNHSSWIFLEVKVYAILDVVSFL